MVFFDFGTSFRDLVNYKVVMSRRIFFEIIRLLYLIFMIFLAFQILKAIFGGTWETENIILAGMGIVLTGVFGVLTILISQGTKIGKMQGMLDEHLRNHKK